MRTQIIKEVTLNKPFIDSLLVWANKYQEVAWLDSNNYGDHKVQYQAMLAVDAFTAIKTDAAGAFKDFDEYTSGVNDWIFGYLSYDLKNDIEQLTSKNVDGLQFPELYFFRPKKLFLFTENTVTITYLNAVADEMEQDWQDILNTKPIFKTKASKAIKVKLRTAKDTYYATINTLLAHIQKGDIYEVNYCQEFYADDAVINPIQVFRQLNEISKAPFATYLKLENYHVLSASPERYIKKTGKHLISQPIKGTAKRADNTLLDNKLIASLAADPKERRENIMITDLVRNDFSKFAEKGSVTVTELCKVYTFKQVHQLISTISCMVPDNVSISQIIKDTFPMGSMTGAPKVRAMEIIEAVEDAKRGVYSGAIGYCSPEGDFDFNVVIRSILYNSKSNYVSYSVGGAITASSTAEGEYEECLLKAKAMREVLTNF